MASISTTARFRQAKRDVVASLEPLFPGVKELSEDTKSRNVGDFGLAQSRYMSSLPLQMSLFYNVCYFPVWLFCTGFIVALKFGRVDLIYQIFLSAILVVFSGLEFGRLYLGFLGNLTEKVPELSGFWLLTLFQLPLLCIYTFYGNFLPLPFETALNAVLLSFLAAQLLFGYKANKTIVKHQLHKFHLLQFTEGEEDDGPQPETLRPLQPTPTLPADRE